MDCMERGRWYSARFVPVGFPFVGFAWNARRVVMVRRMVQRVAGAALLATLVVLGATASAPAEDALLVVRNVAAKDDPEVRLTEAELLAMPQVTVRTRTEFTDGVVEFVGPLARDVVELVGRHGADTAHLVAANDYSVDVPLEDFYAYDVILAMSANGERLTRRDKGPIWLMYPLDDHSELQDPLYNVRLIWQLTTMELR